MDLRSIKIPSIWIMDSLCILISYMDMDLISNLSEPTACTRGVFQLERRSPTCEVIIHTYSLLILPIIFPNVNFCLSIVVQDIILVQILMYPGRGEGVLIGLEPRGPKQWDQKC